MPLTLGSIGTTATPGAEAVEPADIRVRVTSPVGTSAENGTPRYADVARRAARAPRGATPARLDHVHVLTLSPRLDMVAVARQFERLPEVVWAEPDAKIDLYLATSDPYLSTTGAWGQPFRDLWGLERIDAEHAWDVARGAGVVVAITDTGIDPTHPDLAGQLWTNAAEVAGNGIDDDGNGFIDDDWGYDVYNGDNDPADDHGHGTHVAGTVAAAGNNGIGVVGVAWEARVMAVKAFSAGGSGTLTNGAEALLYAIDNGADVINARWGATVDSEVWNVSGTPGPEHIQWSGFRGNAAHTGALD
jgi:subtilisin family serine protease